MEDLLVAGDELPRRLSSLEALDAFREALELDPDRYDALWRAAREGVHPGLLAAGHHDRSSCYEKAESFARRAVEVMLRGVEGHHWLTMAPERIALGGGPQGRPG